MCRLYAMLASHSMGVQVDLLESSNSLLCQSRCDALKRTHPDGWGLVTYPSGLVHRVRSTEPAFMGDGFAMASHRAKSRCVIAHIRLASKGNRKPENCHPFVFGNWSFAHNGTVNAIEVIRQSLVDELPKAMAHAIEGETDSEVLFLWLLNRLRRAKTIRHDRCVSLSMMLEVLAHSLAEIAVMDANAQNSPDQPKTTKLTVVLTNGRVMLASCLGHPLFWLARKFDADTATDRHSVVLASERLSDEPWNELDNASVIGVSNSGKVSTLAFPLLA